MPKTDTLASSIEGASGLVVVIARGQKGKKMNNAEKFREVFGMFATEVWAMPEDTFLKWLKSDTKSASIEPRKKGKWHYTDAYPHWMCCDQCFKKFLPNREWVELYNIPTNFCPNCGADMRGEQDV
jgi:hypothetical protein